MTAVTDVEATVRQDSALLEDDLRVFLGALTPPPGGSPYGTALRHALYAPVADALGSKAGQPALPSAPGTPPLRPSLVFWAHRNYRGFPDERGERGGDTDLATVRRTAVAVRILLKAAVALDDIQDGSTVRYGEPALHAVHGVPLALNTGSWLIASALRHAAEPAVVASLLASVGDGFTGQACDLATRAAPTRAALPAASPEERVRFWESVAVLKTGTLFRMPLDAALAALEVETGERDALDEAMRRLGLASQLFNDLTDVVPEVGGANVHEDFDGLSNRVFLELLDGASEADGDRLKSFVLDHPRFEETILSLSAEAVELKRSAMESVHRVCRSERSARYFDLTIDRKGHLVDRLHDTLRRRYGA
ncbi:polyprenyl synthetase family protein [Streptomyces sp. NPDC047072]|uniref:polyprenyl synthetase family protein n=1 Tax=Streptomyces sp. NPDC047072 TaxID=3154809 RepID=UPI0033CFB3D3